MLLGAGGAGRTAALKLASERVAELFLVNRTQGKAEEIAERNQKTISVREGRRSVIRKPTVDLLLNATSLGLKPDDLRRWMKNNFR